MTRNARHRFIATDIRAATPGKIAPSNASGAMSASEGITPNRAVEPPSHLEVVARSPDRVTCSTAGLLCSLGRPTVGAVARSGDRATTDGASEGITPNRAVVPLSHF